MSDSDSAIDSGDEIVVPQEPIDPMIELFPENWRTISEAQYEFWEDRAYSFCPEGHRLFWILDFTLRGITFMHRHLRQYGEILPVLAIQGLQFALDDFSDQLRIIQIDIVQGPEAARAYAEIIA